MSTCCATFRWLKNGRVYRLLGKCSFLLNLLLMWYILQTHQSSGVSQMLAANHTDTTSSAELLVNRTSIYPGSHCIRERVPRVTHFLETAQYFAFTNKSLARFSEGEISLMRSIPRHFQKADPLLSEALIRVFSSNITDLEIAIPDVFSGFPYYNPANIRWWNSRLDHRQWVRDHADPLRQYFEAHISSPFMHTNKTFCEFLPKIYNTLRMIWEDKDIVILRGKNAQIYKHDIFDNCRSRVVLYAPKEQAWSSYSLMKEELLKQDPTKLFILSVGPTSRVLVYDLVLAGRRALDLGHLSKDYNRYKLNIHNDGDFWIDSGQTF